MSTKGRGILFSYVLGAPLGLFTVLFFFILPGLITGEGLGYIVLLGTFGAGILGLVMSFLFALWFAGKRIGRDLEKGRSLLGASFRYSLRVNTIIWSTFALLSIAQQSLVLLSTPVAGSIDTGSMTLALITLLAAMVAFIGCTLSSTFTIGLLISRLTKG